MKKNVCWSIIYFCMILLNSCFQNKADNEITYDSIGENIYKYNLYEDSYANENGKIMEKITLNNKTWTIRKLEQDIMIQIPNNDGDGTDNTDTSRDPNSIDHKAYIFVLENIECFDKKLFKVYNWTNAYTLAITSEMDTVNNMTDYWVKIITPENKIGWIFGAYTGVERGGFKYLTPENMEFMKKESKEGRCL